PVFGGRVPESALKPIRGVKGNGAKAILVAVFGNRAIDDALVELEDTCRASGFEIIAGIEAVAEHSLARIYGEGRPDTEDKKELISFVDTIKAANSHTPTFPGTRPYKDFKPSAMALSLSDNCINCKLCADSCPVSAISLNNISTVDAEKCFSCMHCVNVCPTKARDITNESKEGIKLRLAQRAFARKENKLYI
ncbi:MAG: 4Fe-4S dicluster domain-containing protein, partial [Ruminococcaceae bacterium]|nr:4Fe-4S dicluster domain-containing protein [Oscillospiraceae bacterium]